MSAAQHALGDALKCILDVGQLKKKQADPIADGPPCFDAHKVAKTRKSRFKGKTLASPGTAINLLQH